MRKKMKKFLSLGILGLMMLSMMSISALAEDSNDGESAITVTGTLTQDAVWEDGTVVGPVTISGGTKEDPITITVNGTVTVDGQITLDQTEDCHVEFVGDGTLIRGANNAGGAMIWSQGGSRVWHTVKIDGLTLDGGAVWTGDVHGTLARGTTNSGVKATGGNAAILFVRYSDVTLKKVTLQNQDNSNMKGCAVNLGYGNLYLEESVVQNNYHAGDRGGAIYMRNAGAVYAKKSFFYGNHGQGAVAGVSGSSAYACIMEFEDCIFSDNYSGSSGALFVVQNYLFPPANSVNYRFRGHLKIDNCVITDNACATKNHGLIYSHCYETPVYITDSTITGNDCNLFGYSSGPNKNLYLSGNTISNIYTGSLSAVPFQITGATGVMELNQTTIDSLVNQWGYVATEAGYEITFEDVAKMLGENASYIKADVNGDGKLDIVPYTGQAPATVSVTVKDGFPESEASMQNVYVGTYPYCPEKDGYVFEGWVDEQGVAVTAADIAEGSVLIARWRVEMPEEVKAEVLVEGNPAGTSCEIMPGTSYSLRLTNYLDEDSYTYQWYHDETLIPGEVHPKLQIPITTLTISGEEAGWHHYTCEVTSVQRDGFSASINEIAISTTVRVKVLKNYVALIRETGKKYDTLTAAVADANGMEKATIELLQDIEQSEPLEITGKDVTIVGEYTITWADNTKTLFTVKPGAALTLDGKVTLDGGNNWVLDSDLYNMYLNAKDPADEDGLKNAVTKDVNGIDMYPVTSENGKSDFGATADMILNQGTLNVNNATIENFFSFKVYYNSRDNYAASSGSVVIRSDSESVTNLNKGSLFQHNASGTGGVIVNVEGQKNWVNYYTEVNVDGATVQNNFAGSNGGMFKVYHATLNIKDGYIYNNKATDANGSVVMLYGGDAILNLYGGEICSNSSAYGYNNGRTAALYFHASSVFNMYGGTICHNTGFSRGGLYLNYNVADINIYGTPVSQGSKFNTGVEIIDNANVRGDATKDIYSGPTAAMYFDIYGGIYTQDVDEWCAPGYVCIPYEESKRTDDFIVVPGYRVLYYSIDGVNDETGEVTTTLVHKELLALDGQDAAEVDLYATPYQAYVGDTNQIISKWYTDVEMTNQWSYKTEVEADTKLYGEWKEDKSVCMIVETGIRYETLAEGVADANDMGEATVKVLQDIYQAEPLTITGKDITMIGEYTIYRDENAVEASKDADNANTDFVPGDQAYDWNLFTVAENAMFTLDGGIVLDGNNKWTLGEYDEEKDGYSPVGEEGKPRASGGAYMIQNNGTLYVLDATLQNQYGNHEHGKGFSGAINVGNNSVTTLDGATIQHIASNDGGTAVFMQNGTNTVLNIKGDTLITDIYGGDNASIIRAHTTDTINMSGGTISNCYCDYGGSLMYFYSGCTMNFTGGIIKDNWGNGNGVFYLHSGTVFNMEGTITEDGTVTGGIIEGNTFYRSAIYGRSEAASLKISGGKIYDNVATYNPYAEKDQNDFYATQSYTEITGGIYTQDVDQWCAPGYVCIPFDKTERTDDFIVVPGYRVSYYAIEQGEYGSAPTTKLVGSEVLLIPVGKHADDVDLFATPYYPVVTEPGRTIEKWYLDMEMTTQWSYETEILENVVLYGDWKYSLEVNMTESGFKEIIQDNNVKVALYQVTDPAVLQKLAELTTAEDWMVQALEVKALTDGKTLVAEGITSQGVWECGYLSAGLYLVDAQQVQTAYNQYDFVPYLIYLPHSYATDDTWFEITEDSSVVRVTPTKIERKGDLEIIKRLNVYNETLEGASFVFQVEGVKKDIDTGRDIVVYSDVLLLTFQEPGVARMVLTDIPAGSVVTVTEIYTGSNYELATDESVTVTVEAKKVEDQGFVNKAEFINTHNRSIKGGTGSVTRFTFDGETWSHQTTVNTAQ